MAKIQSGKDLLMLLSYARGHTGEQCQPIRGRTRLMKMVFLFDKEVKRKLAAGTVSEEDLPRFEPYDYGPFSGQVFSDLQFLVDGGFVAVTDMYATEPIREEADEYGRWVDRELFGVDGSETQCEQEFSLTDLGKEFVESELKDVLDRDEWAILDAFKARCTAASLRSLLRYVYTRYPEMTSESKIRDEIMPRYPD